MRPLIKSTPWEKKNKSSKLIYQTLIQSLASRLEVCRPPKHIQRSEYCLDLNDSRFPTFVYFQLNSSFCGVLTERLCRECATNPDLLDGIISLLKHDVDRDVRMLIDRAKLFTVLCWIKEKGFLLSSSLIAVQIDINPVSILQQGHQVSMWMVPLRAVNNDSKVGSVI